MTHPSFQDKVRTRKITREVFVNDNGAIDLASIMVGIIVIGLIGAIIAATIFAIIPWAQDNAAKQQLDSIKSAEDAYRGLAEDSGISEYGNNLQLANPTFKGKNHPSLIDLKEADVLITTTPGPHPTYTATIKSASGKTFTITNGGKIEEVKTPVDGESTEPPTTGKGASFSNASLYLWSSVGQVSMPADKTSAVVANATVPASAEQYKDLQDSFKATTFTKINADLKLPDGVKNGYSDFNGQADVYLTRPDTVIIKDLSDKVVANYSGESGSMFYYYSMGGSYGWYFESAISDSVKTQLASLKGYKLSFKYNGFDVSVSGTNPDFYETGPTGSGLDIAPQTFQATTVDYIPGGDNGQGYDTQEAYENALNTRDTNLWAFKITVNNPDPNSLPDLSDVPFVQNSDGTYTATLLDGRWKQDAVFKFPNGQSSTLAGNGDMASVGMDWQDFDGRIMITADANKKVTSIRTDYTGVRTPMNSTLAEAKAAIAGSTIEYYPYATKINDRYTQVSTTKTIKFKL